MNSRFFRTLLDPLILATWGVVMLDVVGTGRIRTLLHPVFYPWVTATGIALLAVAVALVFLPGALHPEPWSTWAGRGILLLVPLLLALVVAPSTYSAYTVMNREMSATPSAVAPASGPASGETHYSENSAGPPMAVDLDYLLSAADDPDRRDLLGGKIVEVTGQLYPLDAHEFKLVRLQIWCCAADAIPLNVNVEGDAGAASQTQWVDVTGVVQFRQADSQWQPFLQLRKIGNVSAPADPYLYQAQ